MIEITKQSLIEGLEAIVAEYGADYVYPAKERRGRSEDRECFYVHEGQPDCIVGKFLHSVGVPLERLQEADDSADASAMTLLTELAWANVINADLGVRQALSVAQRWQDWGYTWGDALQRAKELLGQQ